jgi:hypothetical protein
MLILRALRSNVLAVDRGMSDKKPRKKDSFEGVISAIAEPIYRSLPTNSIVGSAKKRHG